VRKRSLLGLTAVALTAYIGVPYLLTQLGNVGLVRRGRGANFKVAVTFDDGPDPRTTPRVLDALREAGVHATFFMLASEARAHPELARRVAEEGHEIAVHGDRHRHAWTRPPWEIGRDLRLAADTVRRVTGADVRYFRPPHGAYTLATLLALRGSGLTGAHWTVESHDWHPDHTPQDVTERVLQHLSPGGVIVLHDAGPGGARTAEALPDLLRALEAHGYVPCALGQLDGVRAETTRDLPVRVLQFLDGAFDRANGVQRAGRNAGSLFRGGPSPFPLDDHPVLRKGEHLLELHVDSDRLVQASEKPLQAMRLLKNNIKEFAQAVRDKPEWQNLPGVFTIGPWADFLEAQGFESYPVPEGIKRRLGVWASVIRWAYGTKSDAREVRLSYIPRDELIRRHAPPKKP